MSFQKDFKTLHRTTIDILIKQLGFRSRYVVFRNGDVIEQQLISTTESETKEMFIHLDDALQEAYRVFTSHNLERYRINQALIDNMTWFRKMKILYWSDAEQKKLYDDFVKDVDKTKAHSEVDYDTFTQQHLKVRTLPEQVWAPAFLPINSTIFMLNADGFIGNCCAKVRELRVRRVYLRKQDGATPDDSVFSFSYGCDGLGEFNPHLMPETAVMDEGEIPYSAMNIRLFHTEQCAIDAFHRVLNHALCHLIRQDGSCTALPIPGNAPCPSVKNTPHT